MTRVLRRSEGDDCTSWIEIEEIAEFASQLARGVDPDRRRLEMVLSSLWVWYACRCALVDRQLRAASRPPLQRV
ncbi:hypothetical protein [Salipiger marinus]|jgi:hypothetical protein|uniref:hypothetical protein n=1 Tax=Salipiger marinus TaxID=555512 RepID=UPI00104236BC|nr:hypothetical protein [Salipiger marinus]